jgi:hypothetical protein
VKDSCFAAFFIRPFPLGTAPNDVEIAIITEPFLSALELAATLIVHLRNLRRDKNLPAHPKNAPECAPCMKSCHSLRAHGRKHLS